MARIRNSALLSTFGVLAAGGVFAYALNSFYPSSGEEGAAVPIVKAESAPIRIEPVDVGGMEIPFSDSTVYDSMRRAENQGAGQIENLLAPSSAQPSEKPMSKEEVAAAVEQQVAELEMAETPVKAATMNITEDVKGSVSDVTEKTVSAASDVKESVTEKIASQVELIEVPIERVSKPIKNILSEEPAQVAVNKNVSETVNKPTAHEAGASPETLAFVRSVLDKKDEAKALKSPVKNTETVAKMAKLEATKVVPQEIEPAAGVQRDVVTKGSHYVQLASISDRSRANSEWAKLKKDLSALPSASGYRVQEASLSKGTFYRIQAGPYGEAQAKSICESIKAQKPGGCLVVK